MLVTLLSSHVRFQATSFGQTRSKSKHEQTAVHAFKVLAKRCLASGRKHSLSLKPPKEELSPEAQEVLKKAEQGRIQVCGNEQVCRIKR